MIPPKRIQGWLLRVCLGVVSSSLVTYADRVHASPTEQEYIKLLLNSAATRGGTAEEAMASIINGSNKDSADDQFRLGSALMRVRHHFAAIEVLTRATKLAPNNSAAFANLGISYYATGNCDGVISALSKAVELDPSGARAGDSSRRLGSCLIFKRDYSKAEEYCTRGVKLLPKDAAPRLCLGNAQFAQGRYDVALATYMEAHSLASNAYPPYRDAAQSGVLASLSKLKRLGEASRTLGFPSTPPYTTESIERRAASAVGNLEKGGKPEW